MRRLSIFFIIALFLTNANSSDIVFKSAKHTSSYYIMSKEITSAIKKTSNGKIDIKVYQSAGSVQNIKDSANRNDNFIFTSPPQLIDLALKDKPPFKHINSKSLKNIRFLFPFPPLVMHFIVKANSNIKSLKDFVGKKLLIGENSFGAYEVKKYANQFGLGDCIDFIEIDLNNIHTSFTNGEIDGFVTSGSYPSPIVTQIANETNISIIGLSDKQIEQTKRTKITIPANTYKNITKNIDTTSVLVGVYASKKMSEELAYKITKYFWESQKELIKKESWWKSVNFENLNAYIAKFHKGALRYYKEIGVIKTTPQK